MQDKSLTERHGIVGKPDSHSVTAESTAIVIGITDAEVTFSYTEAA
jgi:hypothetical protein